MLLKCLKQQGVINRVTKDGKEKALADEKAKLAKYLYENPNIGRWDPMKLEMERAIKHIEDGRYEFRRAGRYL